MTHYTTLRVTHSNGRQKSSQAYRMPTNNFLSL